MKILRICLRVRRPETPCSRVALCWRVYMIINKNCLLCINCPFTRFTELTDIRLEKISAEIVIYWNTKPSVEKLTKGIRSRRLSCHRTGWYLEGEMLALNQNVNISQIWFFRTIIKSSFSLGSSEKEDVSQDFQIIAQFARITIPLWLKNHNVPLSVCLLGPIMIKLCFFSSFSNSIAIPFLWDFRSTQQDILRCIIFRHSSNTLFHPSVILPFYYSFE